MRNKNKEKKATLTHLLTRFGWVPLVLLTSMSAAAQHKTPKLDELILALKTCEAKQDTAERLACYDKLTHDLPEHKKIAATPVSEKTVAKNEASTDFLNITEVWEYKSGYWKIKLINGEVWRLTEKNTRFPITLDGKYYLQTGMFGSYYLRTPGLNSRVRVVKE